MKFFFNFFHEILTYIFTHKSAIHAAIEKSYTDIVQLVLKCPNVDINARMILILIFFHTISNNFFFLIKFQNHQIFHKVFL